MSGTACRVFNGRRRVDWLALADPAERSALAGWVEWQAAASSEGESSFVIVALMCMDRRAIFRHLVVGDGQRRRGCAAAALRCAHSLRRSHGRRVARSFRRLHCCRHSHTPIHPAICANGTPRAACLMQPDGHGQSHPTSISIRWLRRRRAGRPLAAALRCCTPASPPRIQVEGEGRDEKKEERMRIRTGTGQATQ